MDHALTPAIRWIDRPQELEAVAAALENESAVAVDLEADSMYHFQEKVCLLQVATEQICAVIDPICLKDLSCLTPFFSNAGIRKIFHGADYDVRSLYRDFGFTINNLFDTQIACMLLGLRETGLNAVLSERFGIALDKRYQRKDWSRRPLPEEMIEYAARDTLFLKPLAVELEGELVRKGRLEWALEECELLSRVRPAATDESPLFLRFKGAGKLNRRSLAVLESLLSLRRDLAQKKDRPPYKIVSNQALMALAGQMPATLKQASRMRVLSPKQLQMFGQAVVTAINRSLEIPEERLPVYPRKRAVSMAPAVPLRLQALKSWREGAVSELEMDPGVLINNTLLNAIALQNPGSMEELACVEGMKHWQVKAFGREILRALKSSRKMPARTRRRGRASGRSGG